MRDMLRKVTGRGRRRGGVAAPGFPPLDGLHYHKVLSEIEARTRPEWYLEIGSRSGTSISHRTCNFVAVDPEFAVTAPVFNRSRQMHFFQMTSDDFFSGNYLAKLGIRPDLAFIDGMHLFEFALRDFMNAEAAMERDGVICLHDICPYDHAMSARDPASGDSPGAWTGDVWKVVAILRDLRPDLQLDVLSAHSTGLACVTRLDPGNRILHESYDALIDRYTAMTLADFGVDAFYRLAALRDPTDYLAGLAPTSG